MPCISSDGVTHRVRLPPLSKPLDAKFCLLWWLVCGPRLQVWIGSCAFDVFCRNRERQRVGQAETDKTFRRNLNLLPTRDGIGSSSYAAAGCGADCCSLASTKNAAKDSAHSSSTADFFSCVFAAAFTLHAVGLSADCKFFATAVDAGEFNGEQGVAFVMSGFLNSGDSAGDECPLTDYDEAVDENVRCDGAGEAVALLSGRAIERLGDADRDRSIRWHCDVTEHGRRR